VLLCTLRPRYLQHCRQDRPQQSLAQGLFLLLQLQSTPARQHRQDLLRRGVLLVLLSPSPGSLPREGVPSELHPQLQPRLLSPTRLLQLERIGLLQTPRRPLLRNCQEPPCPVRKKPPCVNNTVACCEGKKKMLFFQPCANNNRCNNNYCCKCCTTERCKRCGEKVFAAEKVLTSYGAYHLGCFSCYCCCKSLCVKTMYEACGEIYCR
ncbi:unnamed protein product, partial [Tenebrio molitor]